MRKDPAIVTANVPPLVRRQIFGKRITDFAQGEDSTPWRYVGKLRVKRTIQFWLELHNAPAYSENHHERSCDQSDKQMEIENQPVHAGVPYAIRVEND